MNAADVIRGGAGVDTLSIVVQDQASGNVLQNADIAGVEVINVRGTVGANTVTAASLSADVTNVNNDRGVGVLNVGVEGDLAGSVQVGMIGNGSTTVGAVSASYLASVTSVTANLSGGLQTSAAGVPLAGAGTLTLGGTGITTATINSTNGANVVNGVAFSGGAVTQLNINAQSNFGLAKDAAITGFSAAQTSTVTVTGSGAVTANVLNANLDVYNASAATGAQTLTVGAATQMITTGSGNDTVTAGNVALTTGRVNAGAGNDTLIVSNAAVVTAGTGKFYSNFETVRLADGITLDLDFLASTNQIGAVQFNGSGTATNLTAAQAGNISARGATAALTLGVSNASGPGQIDTVKIAATTTTAAGVAQTVTLNGSSMVGVEKLELTGTGTVAATSGAIVFTTNANTAQLDSIKLTTAGGTVAAANQITVVNGASNMIVDASGSTGAVVVNATDYNATTGIQIKGGSANDTITSSARADILDITAGGRDFISAVNSLVSASDIVKGFGLVTTAINDVSTITQATFQAVGATAGGANADIIEFSVGAITRAAATGANPIDVAAASGNGAALDIKAVVSDRGLLTVTGADAAQIDTLAEFVAVANAATPVAGNAVVFNFGGNAYLFREVNADTALDNLATLEGVSATGISIVGVAGTALVGEVLVEAGVIA